MHSDHLGGVRSRARPSLRASIHVLSASCMQARGGSEETMAADRPLLVLHDEKDSHLVYDLLLLDDGEDETLACFPRPVAQFPSQWCCSFTVSVAAVTNSIVGAQYDSDDTFFHDTVMKVGGYDFWERQASPRLRDSEGRLVQWWPKFRRYCSRFLGGRRRDKPAMLPMADGTVVRMDPILFDGIYTFETLRPLPGDGGGWHAAPLPNPPVGLLAHNEVTFVSAYLALGTRAWISVAHDGAHKGTFSLDTKDGTWRREGAWLLPFEGRAMIYVPELDSVIGLTAETRLLCACDVKAGTPPVVRHVWRDTFPQPWEEFISDGHEDHPPSKPRDMPSLAYLGKGRFCICRPMSTMEPNDGPVWNHFFPTRFH